jgi:hypothetical protein
MQQRLVERPGAWRVFMGSTRCRCRGCPCRPAARPTAGPRRCAAATAARGPRRPDRCTSTARAGRRTADLLLQGLEGGDRLVGRAGLAGDRGVGAAGDRAPCWVIGSTDSIIAAAQGRRRSTRSSEHAVALQRRLQGGHGARRQLLGQGTVGIDAVAVDQGLDLGRIGVGPGLEPHLVGRGIGAVEGPGAPASRSAPARASRRTDRRRCPCRALPTSPGRAGGADARGPSKPRPGRDQPLRDRRNATQHPRRPTQQAPGYKRGRLSGEAPRPCAT